MARTSKTLVSSPTTKALVPWDEELAKAAQEASKLASQQASGGSKQISIRAGTMTIDDNPVPGNTLVGVISAFTMCNKFYDSDFDPDQPTSPVCYAYGIDKTEMGPHDEAEDKQADKCEGCPKNEFGTSDRGRGKACRNTYQLLVLPCGSYDVKQDQFDAPEGEEDLAGELYGLSVPPTSLKAFAGYVSQRAAELRPPWAVFTKIMARPDQKTQVALSFQFVSNADVSLLATLKKRHEEAARIIEVPFPKNSEREAAKPVKRPGKRRF
jgi:hypothetical protein